MLLTLSEARAEVSSSLNTAQVIDITAGLSDSLRTACNRIFAHRVEDVVADGSNAILTVYRHGFTPGQKVRVSSNGLDSDLDVDGTISTSNFGIDKFQIVSTISQGDADDLTEVTVRPIQEFIGRTRYIPSVFVPWRPLVEVLSVSTPDGDGGWTELESTAYTMEGGVSNGVSLSGEIELIDGTCFPGGKLGRRWHPAGVKVEYVAGEAAIPPGIVYAMKNLVKNAQTRATQSEFASESHDYYSYSKLTPDQIGKLFGEAEHIISQLRIPA